MDKLYGLSAGWDRRENAASLQGDAYLKAHFCGLFVTSLVEFSEDLLEMERPDEILNSVE